MLVIGQKVGQDGSDLPHLLFKDRGLRKVQECGGKATAYAWQAQLQPRGEKPVWMRFFLKKRLMS